jgi:hypothetical protein
MKMSQTEDEFMTAMRSRTYLCICLAGLLLLGTLACAAEDVTSPRAADPLLQMLERKGVLSPQDMEVLTSSGTGEQRDRLIELLRVKGILSSEDYAALDPSPAPAKALPWLIASINPALPAPPPPAPQTAVTNLEQPKPSAPKVVPAVAPLRVLQLEPSSPGGMIPDIKLGSGARLKLYGLMKASVIYDSSSPYGTDMPIPAFIGGAAFDPGPHSAEFHAKARFARFGTNFEWPDLGKGTAITGKFEFDFEGNFSRALNRNVSTIRSSMASIRLAYGRVDQKLTDKTSVFGLFGQDWTPFGSSTLPNLYETTGMGLGFGTLYERAPQFRFGVGQKLGGSRNWLIQPEFALVMPAFGNAPKLVDNQLGYGERQGADSGRPEYQARIVTQWQLDRAPGVAPAQVIFSGVHAGRYALVRAADVPSAFRAAFPNGADAESHRYGWSGELQLPTRYVTTLFKYWSGADLRWYFVGGLLSTFNDRAGLTCPGSATFTPCEAPSIDGSSTVVFGQQADGSLALAPQRPVRSQGGFINLAFPLSRIFGANPAGRNAGWQLHFHYALDLANPGDVRHIGNERQKNDLGAGTLFYKMNNLVSFVFEQSYYRTRAVGDPTGAKSFPIYQGYPSRSWHDLRTEVGPIFTF